MDMRMCSGAEVVRTTNYMLLELRVCISNVIELVAFEWKYGASLLRTEEGWELLTARVEESMNNLVLGKKRIEMCAGRNVRRWLLRWLKRQ
jgi:hypothetical protein